MLSLFAEASLADVGVLFVVLAVIGFAVALYLAFTGRVIEGLIAALIAIIILVFA